MTTRQRVSLIMTIFNERDSVARFFDDLGQFTRLPDELVIVDGGSNDGTVQIIRDHLEDAPVPVTLIEERQCNIARGRNIAINNAQYDVIAITDMGCTIAPDWLEQIVAPFEADASVDVVSGYYEPICHTPLQYCYHYLTYNPDIDRAHWLPSSRSLALRRHVFDAVGGYPEHIITGEDTLFDIWIRRQGFKEVFVAGARVYWEVKRTYGLYYHQYYRYARGAGRGLVQPVVYAFYAGNYALFAAWIAAGLLVHPAAFGLLAVHGTWYSWFRIFKKELTRKHLSPGNIARYYALTFVIDWASIVGFGAGLVKFALRIPEDWGPAKDKILPDAAVDQVEAAVEPRRGEDGGGQA